MQAHIRNEKAAKAPVIMIHGAAGNSGAWVLTARALMNDGFDRPMHLIDLPGHGATGGEACSSIEEYAQVAADYIAGLNAGPCVVAGHSMGGAISQILALDHADLVSGAVLVGTGPRILVSPALLEMLPDRYDLFIPMIEQFGFAPGADRAIIQAALDDMGKCDPKTAKADFEACNRFDVRHRLGELTTPSVAISGELDQLIPAKVGAKFTAAPNLTFRVIPGIGHMLPMETPGETAKAVKEICSKIR